jgi:zinc transporter ZupT
LRGPALPCCGSLSATPQYLFALLAALGLQSIDTLIKRASIAAPLSATEPCTDVDCPSEPSLTAPGTKHTHDRSALVSLISAEFGFTSHSVFVGLAVGIVSDDDLKALLVALCFHQFFEGVSLGARLIDAPTVTTAQALLYAFIFAISAPIGIGTGVGIMSAEESLNVNGETFLIVQGVFDAICAGLLLQIGFSMLINDFPTDLAKVAPKDDKYATAKVAALFVTLWGGAGAMSFLGKYL